MLLCDIFPCSRKPFLVKILQQIMSSVTKMYFGLRGLIGVQSVASHSFPEPTGHLGIYLWPREVEEARLHSELVDRGTCVRHTMGIFALMSTPGHIATSIPPHPAYIHHYCVRAYAGRLADEGEAGFMSNMLLSQTSIRISFLIAILIQINLV